MSTYGVGPNNTFNGVSYPSYAAAVAAVNAAIQFNSVDRKTSRGGALNSSTAHYTIQTTGAVECAFAHLQINSGLIYVHGGDVAGVLQDAAGDCYVGRSPKFLTEIRVVGDQNLPVIINETAQSQKQEARTYVKGVAGDKILLVYR